MFKGDSGKWSRWALEVPCGGWGVGRAAAGGCEGARARARMAPMCAQAVPRTWDLGRVG